MTGCVVTARALRLTIAMLVASVAAGCGLGGINVRVKRNGVVVNEVVAPTSPDTIATFDVNGDGIQDVVMTNPSGLTVFLASTDSYDYEAVSIPSSTALGAAYGGTLDRDDLKDLVARTQNGLVMVLDLGSLVTAPPIEILDEEVEPWRSASCVADFDNDGDDDIGTCLQITPQRPAAALQILINGTPVGENTEASDWTQGESIVKAPPPPPLSPLAFFSVSSGDINNDANIDLLVSDPDGCYALAGNGDCTFDPIDPVTGATIPGGAIEAGAIPGIPEAFSGHLADLDQDGDSDLIVIDQTPQVHLNNGAGVFGPAQTFGTGLTGHAAPVFIDFDSSGTLDIVTLINAGFNFANSYLVTVTSVNPDGTLQPTIALPTTMQPTCAAPFIPEPGAAPGLLVASFYGNRLTLHRNIDGQLAAFQRYYAESVGGARSIAVGDLTGDGYPDVYYSTFQSVNRVLVNRGDGSGIIDGVIPGRNASNIEHITFIERPALGRGTVACAFVPTNLVVFSNLINNDAQFRFNESHPLPSAPRGIAAGDFNTDGRTDALVLLDTPNPGAAICFQDAPGTFAAPLNFDLIAGTTPQGWWTHCAPIDAETGADSFAVYGPGGAGVFRNNGAGFDFFSAFGTGFSGGTRIDAGDLNGDGKADLVVARDLGSSNGALTLALSTNPGGPTPTFAPPVTINLIGAAGGVALCDLDNDGDLDIAAACNTGVVGEVHWTVVMLNDGAGAFPDDDVSLHLAGNAPKQVLAADLHNPGGSLRGAVLPATAGAELIIAAGGPASFEGVQVLTNIADFAAPPETCAGDADGNGVVNFADVTSVLTNFGADYSPGSGEGDADRNGVVNFADITDVLTFFGVPCG